MIYSLVSSASTNYTKLYVTVHAEGTLHARYPCDTKVNLQLKVSYSHIQISQQALTMQYSYLLEP
jgi:hypothetical protein